VDDVGTGDGLGALTTWGQSLLAPKYVAGAVYYPWIEIADPANKGRPRLVPPSGSVAGVYATVDTTRGVWKAPAGVETSLTGVAALADRTLGDEVNGTLNVAGVNCLRTFPVYGTIVWGARTLAGSDLAGSPWKYVPVRRLADFVEQSLRQSLRWVVFEPNSESRWSSIALEVNGFLSGLFAQGAFVGTSATQAYQVVCDATTTSPDDMLRGIVNLHVAFAPVQPAEFVVLTLELEAGAPAA
jgi:phage tail sheath protein FI